MNRRNTLKLLGSLPLMAFGATRVNASEHQITKTGAQNPKNIVLISADGMGVCQWQAAMVAAHGKLNLGRMQSAGLLTTNPADVFCGDAPSHSTALATGVNSHKGAVSVDMDNVVLSSVIDYKQQLLSAKRFIIVACGTSWHAGLIGKQIIENYCRIPVEVEYASEFRYRNPVINSDDVVIAISQSGETADTLAAVKLAKDNGAFIYGICNAIGSSIPRATHTGCYIHVGPEIGVASTKAFTGQVTVLTMLALALAKEKGTIRQERYMEIVRELHAIPQKMKEVLKLNSRIADLSRTFTYARNFLYLGRGYSYPVALEGALKLKEISYIHAEGYPAAEMKHGPIALIDSDMPVVVIATHNAMYEKVVSNIQEVKARKGKVIAIVTRGDDTIARIADELIEMPSTIECLEPLLATIPLQLLAYHVAVCKGLDVDQPRNLAKSVTVE